MSETISETIQISSEAWVSFTTGDGHFACTMTGVALITARGTDTGDYRRDIREWDVPIRDLPSGQGLRLTKWAPFVTLNSISDDGAAVNAGWAVDDFKLESTDTLAVVAKIKAYIAVRDVDAFVLRLGYAVHLVGSLEPIPLHKI
jgi:hypothetical protein